MPSAKDDCEALLDVAMPFAEQMFQKYGEFYPFGAAMTAAREVVNIAAHDNDDMPQSADLIAMLQRGFFESAAIGEYLATALVSDVRITLSETNEKSDAISVSLDHRDNFSVVLLYPYRLEDGGLTITDCIEQQGNNTIFPSH